MGNAPGLTKNSRKTLSGLTILSKFRMDQQNMPKNASSNGTSAAVPGEGGSEVCLFLCGDVMTGRGVDQILPHPSEPHLFEMCVKNAKEYVQFAEMKKGPLPKRPVDFAYPWGDALAVLEERKPDVRIINLETSVTSSEENWPGKGIHYRMQPDNVPCLCSARLDCCVLANNHVLDWGHRGLHETLDVLHSKGIRTAGAGKDRWEAEEPARMELDGGRGRVLVYAWGDESSGIEEEWAASGEQGGVNFLREGISSESAQMIGQKIAKERRAGDVVVLSIHWGGNWGFHISRQQRQFAHSLIDSGMVDILHGHSSHHAKGLEVYKDKLILYGCGDFLNDYEGISGHDEYHDEFTLMYFPTMSTQNGKLVRMEAVPMLIEHMRLNRAPEEAASWLFGTMKRESGKFGVRVERDPKSNIFTFTW